jgi:hypothetical protein
MGGRRLLGILAAVGLVVGPAALVVATASPAGATTYSATDDASFRAGWTDNASATVQINLQNDISLSCAGLEPSRDSPNPVTINGNHHVISYDTTPCNHDLLDNFPNTGSVTIQNATLVHNGTTTFVLQSSSGMVTLSGVAVQQTSTTAFALFAGSGAVMLTNSTVAISSTSGEAVFTNGPISLDHSSVSGTTDGISIAGGATITLSNGSTVTTTASGPAISAGTTVALTDSAVLGSSTGNSPGIAANGAVSLTNSTVARPSVNGQGIFTNEDVSLTNSTVTNNGGNGIESHGGNVTLVYADVVNNGFGIGGSGGKNIVVAHVLTSFGSVVTHGQGGNCQIASSASHGFNFTDDPNTTTSCHFNQSTDHVGASNDPLLGPLADNGGPTPTLLPQDGPSPLIDAIPSAHCGDGNTLAGFTITTDQRLLPRPDTASPSCDIGAVEVQPAAPATPVAPTLTVAFTG